ncbi:MAG: HD domain-containing protein [Candidatus Omnitrophota bacterium]|nr:MAG: HD domain-containing protein [Candidatus Omnitrophota bacterium]
MIDFSKIPRDDNESSSGESDRKEASASPIDFSSLKYKKKTPEDKKPSSTPFKKDTSCPQESNLQDRTPEAKKMYEEAVSYAEKIFQSGPATKINVNGIIDIVRKFIDFIGSGAQEFLDFVFSKNSWGVHYLSLKSVNGCVFALEVGLWMGFKKEELSTLGVASFLHDIGLRAYLDRLTQSDRLEAAECEAIKQHTLEGVEILQKIKKDIDPSILEIIGQTYERIDGSGYPKGIKGDDINTLAQVIGLADVYETLTHDRPYRVHYSPLEAMRIILNSKNSFNPKLVKLFLEKIGLYPRGTMVELNTKEVARVIQHNPSIPLAPRIKVVYDSQRKKLEEPRQIDLSDNPTIYITKCL